MTKPRHVAFVRDYARWCSGQGTSATSPGGFAYGIDRAEADAIAEAIHDAIKAGGGNPRPLWQPQTAYSEQRLIDAYRRRGLTA